MKKRILFTTVLLTLALQTAAFAQPAIPGDLDRVFEPEHTMYFVEISGDTIPDITGSGYETLRKATQTFQEGGPLLEENVTIVQDKATGKRYRFAFVNTVEHAVVSEVSISSKGELTVTGSVTGAGTELKCFILKPTQQDPGVSYTWPEVDQNNMEKQVLDVVAANQEDGPLVQYQFPASAQSGAYGILLVGEQLDSPYYNSQVFYTSEADLESAFAGFNAIAMGNASQENVAAMAEYIKDNSRMLYFDPKYFGQLSDQSQLRVCSQMFTDVGYENIDAMLLELYKNMIVSWCGEGKSPQTILEAYHQQVQPTLYESYQKLASKALVDSAIVNVSDYPEFDRVFARQVTISMVNEAASPAAVEAVMDNQLANLNLSKEAEQKYKSEKSACIRALYKRQLKTTADIERIIDETYAAAHDEKNTGSSGSSGRGNSSHSGASLGSGGFPMSAVQAYEPESEIIPVESDFPFTDCENHSWARTALKYLYQNGIVAGRTETLFYPDETVKREEFVKLVVSGFDLMGTAEIKFEDIDPEEWYAEPVAAAISAEIINGISETEFGVGSDITREDMAVMIYRAVGAAGLELEVEVENPAELSDMDEVSDYAKEAVNFLVSKGVIRGSDGSFLPRSYATRAEAAQIIYQAIKIR